ncbi:MAG: molybdenum cofactor biosynthesis protein MoaE [Bacteroidales bacterium]
MQTLHFQFITGPIAESSILEMLANQLNNKTGAQSLFIGRVRADEIEDSVISAIDYSAYEDLAYREAEKIMQELQEKFELHYLTILHSIGRVEVNQIAVAIITSSIRRSQAIAACSEAINMIKQRLPIWGMEITQHGQVHWKVNTPTTSHNLSIS